MYADADIVFALISYLLTQCFCLSRLFTDNTRSHPPPHTHTQKLEFFDVMKQNDKNTEQERASENNHRSQ